MALQFIPSLRCRPTPVRHLELRRPRGTMKSESNVFLLCFHSQAVVVWAVGILFHGFFGWKVVMAKEKEKGIEVPGVVTEALANTNFRVQLDTGHTILAYVAGRMRKNFIRIVPGDRVRVEISPYDPTKGRITYRER